MCCRHVHFDSEYNGWPILHEFDVMYVSDPIKEFSSSADDTTESRNSRQKNLSTNFSASPIKADTHLTRLKRLNVVSVGIELWQGLKRKPYVGSCVDLVERLAEFSSVPVKNSVQTLVKFLPTEKVNIVCDRAVKLAVSADQVAVKIIQSVSKPVYCVKDKAKDRAIWLVDKFVNSSAGYFVLQLTDLLITIMTYVLGSTARDETSVHVEDLETDKKDGKFRQPPSSIERLTGRTSLFGMFTWVIMSPFRILLSSLWFMRNTLIPYRKDKSDIFTPSKAYISRRKRLSPVKRAPSRSFIRRFTTHILGFLGIRPMARVPKHKIKYTTAQKMSSSDDPGQLSEKRRFSDVSEESDEDINYLDEGMSDYVSDEDPDYVPPDANNMSDDSYEYEEGDTESFIELDDSTSESPSKRKTVTSKAAMNRPQKNKDNDKTDDKKSFAQVTSDQAGDNPIKTKELSIDLKRVDAGKENNPKREKRKSGKPIEDKENKAPEKPKPFSPSKTNALKPQNTSSPVLRPDWQKTKPNPAVKSDNNQENIQT